MTLLEYQLESKITKKHTEWLKHLGLVKHVEMKTNPFSPLNFPQCAFPSKISILFAPTFVFPSLSSAHQHTSLSLSLFPSLFLSLSQLLSLFVNKTPVSLRYLSLTVHLAGHIVCSLRLEFNKGQLYPETCCGNHGPRQNLTAYRQASVHYYYYFFSKNKVFVVDLELVELECGLKKYLQTYFSH